MVDKRFYFLTRQSLPAEFIVGLALAVAIFIGGIATRAQTGRPGPDPVLVAFNQAMRESRYQDAEKILTDAIPNLEQTQPNSVLLAEYLSRLAAAMQKSGNHREAAAVRARAAEIYRIASGPDGIEAAGALLDQARVAQQQGDIKGTERLMLQAVENARSNITKLKSGREVDLAALTFGTLASFYVDQSRWVDAEPLLVEEKRLCNFFEVPYRAGSAMCGSLPDRLAKVYSAEGRQVDAERTLSAASSEGEFGQPEILALNKVAERFEKDGLYPSAEETYARGIALAEKIEASPENRFGGLVVAETELFGQLFQREHHNAQAEREYLAAMDIDEKYLARLPEHSPYAEHLSFRLLLDLYREEGRLKDIEPVILHILALQEKALGQRNRAVLQTMMALANVYKDEGKDSEAQTVNARILAIQASIGDDGHAR
jgi:tetratricopeptide (TPR) repeat protein